MTFGVEMEFRDSNWEAVAADLTTLKSKLRNPIITDIDKLASGGKTWDLKYDCTVCDGERGGELATPILTPNSVSFNEIKSVVRMLNKHYPNYDAGTGLHVHVDLGTTDRFLLSLLYYSFAEPINIWHSTRKCSQYAKSPVVLTAKYDMRTLASLILLGNPVDQLVEEKDNALHFYELRADKYIVEFRFARMSRDPHEVVCWVKTCLALVEYASHFRDVYDLLQHENRFGRLTQLLAMTTNKNLRLTQAELRTMQQLTLGY